VLTLAVLTGALFGPALAGRGVFFQRDVAFYWRPQLDSVVRVLAEGALPVWNPYFEVGLPLLADPGYQLYYPPHWVNLLVGPDRFYALYVAAHAALAAVGALALGRAWGLDRVAALGFASAWMASGPLLSLVSNNPQLGGAAWIPWVLLALERALRRPTARSAALLGAVAALQLLAGSGDFALMTAQCAAARLGLWVLRAPVPRRARLGEAARIGLVGGAFALALSAPLWVPTLAVVRAGGRAHMEPGLNAYWSVHPASLVDLVVPRAVARLPLTPQAREILFEAREPFLPSLYLGAAAALLAVLGLTAPRRRGLLLLALFLALLATALGRHGVVHAWVLKMPGASLFRYPVKYLLPAALFWAALAGFGLAALGEEWDARRRRLARLLGGAALAVAAAAAWAAHALPARPDLLEGIAVDRYTASVGLAGRLLQAALALSAVAALVLARSVLARPHPALPWAALAVVAADLVAGARGLNPLAPPALMAHRPALLPMISARGDGFPTRVLSRIDDLAALNRRVARGPAGWDREWSWALGLVDHLSAPVGARWGLGGAYDGDFTGLAPEALSAYSGVVRHPHAGALARTLLRVGAIDYVVSLEPGAYGLPEVASVPSVYDTPLRLFRVADAAPRVYLARARSAVAPWQAWEVLADPSFDPAREVVLVTDLRLDTPLPQGRIAVTHRRPDRVELDVTLAAPALAVLTEMRAPGWTATVDGGAVPVEAANLLFCAAAVPAGRHRVVFEYRAPGARAGLLAGAGGLVALAAVSVGRGRARGLPRPEPSATIPSA
jgi:hypothetical protein